MDPIQFDRLSHEHANFEKPILLASHALTDAGGCALVVAALAESSIVCSCLGTRGT